MTKDERQELREIQEVLIGALAKVTEMLGNAKPKSKPSPKPPGTDYDSESKERWIAR